MVQLREPRQDDNDVPRIILLVAASVMFNSQLPSPDSLDLTTASEDIIASLNFTGSDLCVMELYKTVETLTLIHISRFHSKGDQCDLDYAIYLLEIMTQLLDTSTFATFDELHKLYFVLVGMHLIRCYLFDEPVYLDSLNGSYEAFLEETYGRSGYTAYRTMFSFGLAYNLTFHLATTKDCDRVLQLYNDTYSFESGDMCRYWDYLRSNSLQFLSISGRKFHDLTGALECIRVATEVAAYPSHKEHAPKDVQFLMFQLRIAAITGDRDFLLKVGEEIKVPASRCRYLTISSATRNLFRDDSDESLNDAIRTLKDRCRACPEEDPCGRWYSIVVAIALLCRYERYADDRDIEEAWAFRDPFEPDDVLRVDVSLYRISQQAGFSGINGNRWPTPEYVKALACINQSNISPRRHSPEGVFFFNDSGTSSIWCRIADVIAHPGDDVSFHDIHEWLLSRCKSSGDPTVHLLILSCLYWTRYSVNKQIEDLEKGADYFLQVLNTRTVPSGGSSLAIILFDLERLKPGSFAPSLLLDRFDCVLERVHNITLPIADRLHHLTVCYIILSRHLPGLEQSQASHALEIGNLLVSLTEQQCWASSNPHSSLGSRYNYRNLHLSVATLIIKAAREDGLLRAVEIFEMGRSLVWNQLENLRTSPPASVPPDLAADFLNRSRTLERRIGFSHEIGTDLPSTDHGRLVKDRNNIIEQIRALPGCESFLSPQPFRFLCKAAAAEGPVVLLASAGFAVVIHHSHVGLVPLPLAADRLQKWKDSLRSNRSTRDVDCGGLSDGPRVPSTSAARDPRAGVRPPKSKMTTYEILKELWDKVAKPVIDMIEEITMEGTKGKGTASIPVSYSAPNELTASNRDHRNSRSEAASGGAVLVISRSCLSMQLEYIAARTLFVYQTTTSHPTLQPLELSSRHGCAHIPIISRSWQQSNPTQAKDTLSCAMRKRSYERLLLQFLQRTLFS